jgi:SP family xylose:H+ symportor-like MFS transporter
MAHCWRIDRHARGSEGDFMITKTNYPLVVMLTIAATLGGLLFGYDTAVISGATDAITYNFVTPRHLPEAEANFLSGFAIGSALLGCVLGAAIAGPISTWWGRRTGLLIAGILFFLSSLGAGFPEFLFGAHGPAALPFFIFYRLMGGTAIGMASMLAPMYIAEIAPPSTRGLLVTFQQIAIVVGINLVYFVNYFVQSLGDRAFLMERGWRYMLASAAIPATLLIVFMLIVPETPRYLVLKDRTADALALLKRLGGGDPDSTLAEIEATLVQHTRPLLSYGWLVLIIGIMLSVFQQVVGINAVLYFAPKMFQNMGATQNQAYLESAWFVGVTMTLFTLVATVTVDRVGRKPLVIAGALIMAAAMITLGTLFDTHAVAATVQAGATSSSGASYIAIGAVVIYIIGFSFSWGPVTWVMLSEIFPNSIKGKAMSIAVAAQWIANFVVSQTFPMLDGSSALNAAFNHGFAYWLYGAGALLAALFVSRFVPETKQRSLEAIEQIWVRAPAA